MQLCDLGIVARRSERKEIVMTLKTIIDKLSDIAIATPNVRSVVINDIYRENALQSVDYATIGILQDEHTVTADTVTYGITLVYIDRLLPDASNEVDIQSNGMITLAHIINALQEDDEVSVDDEVTYTSYNQRFADDCAGVYATVNITAEAVLGMCPIVHDKYQAYITTEGEAYMTAEGEYYLINE